MTTTPSSQPTPGSVAWYTETLQAMTDDQLRETARRGLVRNYRTAVRRELKRRGIAA